MSPTSVVETPPKVMAVSAFNTKPEQRRKSTAKALGAAVGAGVGVREGVPVVVVAVPDRENERQRVSESALGSAYVCACV